MSSELRHLLSPAAVRLNVAVKDKWEAIRTAGALLVQANCVEQNYIEEMLQREKLITSYIGSGVAIPHGTESSRNMVIKTGLSYIQVPQGVDFDGETAYIIIGIAAKDENHLQVLANLAEILMEASTVQELIAANSYEEVCRLLTLPAASID